MATKNLEREEKRKLQIVGAAYEVIATKGYSFFTLEDIANTAGLSKGGVLHYFKTKEDILIHLLERIYNVTEENIRNRSAKYRTAERKIKSIIIAYIIMAKRTPEFYILVFHFLAQTTVNDRIREVFNKIHDLMYNEIKKVIDIGIENAEFNNVNSPLTAHAIQYMIIGVASQWLFAKSYNIDHMTRTCLSMTMAYLKKKP